jgi:hypothetical protein
MNSGRKSPSAPPSRTPAAAAGKTHGGIRREDIKPFLKSPLADKADRIRSGEKRIPGSDLSVIYLGEVGHQSGNIGHCWGPVAPPSVVKQDVLNDQRAGKRYGKLSKTREPVCNAQQYRFNFFIINVDKMGI